jgi:hypothetical protein
VMRSVIEYSRQRPPRHFPREAPNAGIAVRHNRLPRPLPASWPHSMPLTVSTARQSPLPAGSASRRPWRPAARTSPTRTQPGSPRTRSGRRPCADHRAAGLRKDERTVAFAGDEAPKRIARPVAARRPEKAQPEAGGRAAEGGRPGEGGDRRPGGARRAGRRG